MSTILPYLYACGVYRGYLWKGLIFYIIYREIDAIYDFGMYFSFFLKGPSQIKRVLQLDPERSFAQIQAALYMKYSAKVELDRAMGKTKRKGFLELVMIRSFKNQARDSWMQWRNLFSYIKWQRQMKKEGKDE